MKYNWKYTEPPKHKKVLACIKLCGKTRVNVVKWSDIHNTWITDIQLNHIHSPICWMDLPNIPKDANV